SCARQALAHGGLDSSRDKVRASATPGSFWSIPRRLSCLRDLLAPGRVIRLLGRDRTASYEKSSFLRYAWSIGAVRRPPQRGAFGRNDNTARKAGVIARH